ncbi:Cation H+ exchanger [Cordyceps militaris]|uniref:Cation H+ exchanger n=1 Tax=Cordyceps militaris TaxID=73501 RepID=A0A2H4SH38_CORMI|nr:Cation H+ exchanger [Cordyceps militaris]
MRRAVASVVAVAYWATAAESMVLTLSAVEMIASFAVPLSCIFAYNTPLTGCEITDFTSGQCAKGESGECCMQESAATADVNSFAVTTDAFVEFGSFNHFNISDCYSNFFGNIFRNDDIHGQDINDRPNGYVDDRINPYIDDRVNDYIHNPNHNQLDGASFKLEYRVRYRDGHGVNFYNLKFLARNNHNCR